MNIHDLTQVDMVNYIIGGNVEIIFIQFSLEKKNNNKNKYQEDSRHIFIDLVYPTIL